MDFLIHRIGRTGRNKMAGTAITFYDPGEENKVADIEHMGIKFEPKDIKNGEIVDAKERDRRTTRKADQEKLDTKLVGFVKKQKNKRKPGYKKKIKQAISEEHRQQRKVRIRQDRRQEREARKNKNN